MLSREEQNENGGRDLNFRDRVIEFIGRTSTSIRNIEGDIMEIKDTAEKRGTDQNDRICKAEARLKIIEDDYLVTKTKIGVWAGIASVAITVVIWIGKLVLQYLGVLHGSP